MQCRAMLVRVCEYVRKAIPQPMAEHAGAQRGGATLRESNSSTSRLGLSAHFQHICFISTQYMSRLSTQTRLASQPNF